MSSTKQMTTTERQEETARLIGEARATLERLHEERGNALLRGEADTVAQNRATVAKVEANLADLVTLQARLEVERATEQAEEERQHKADLQQKLEGADLKARSTRAALSAAVKSLAVVVAAARQSEDAANAIKRDLGLNVGHADSIGNLVLFALVEAGVIQSTSLNIPAGVLRRLAEDPLEHARKVEAERAVREAAARAYDEQPDVIKRRIALLETRASGYRADLKKYGQHRAIAAKLQAVAAEITALEQKLENAA